MATHSSVLAWRIPGTGEPGGLQSLGSHRVRHDWSDLAAAVPVLGAYLQLYDFLRDWSLDHYVMSFLISYNLLYFKVYFVWYEDCCSSFLLLSICMECIFPSSHFQSIWSLGLKWVSYRQHIYRSCLCIYSASLYLLVEAFNPFTFKMIINMYVSIAIFLIVWGWFCRSYFSLVFLDYVSPFNICCKAGLVVLNFVNFCFSEKHFISPHQFWMRSLLGTVILVVDFPLSLL